MAQEPSSQPGSNVSEHLQDLVLECADVAELLNELATFSAFTLSVHNDLLCGVTLMRRKSQQQWQPAIPVFMPWTSCSTGSVKGPA